ncbi:MAG: DUF2256 domain-containing protein [Psychrobacter sp.]|nr:MULTISPECIES: DUF2256 domain-containing protein [unclassified Psychrobacter]
MNLPQKTCPVCQRLFTSRKKWEQVFCCSERCWRGKNKSD